MGLFSFLFKKKENKKSPAPKKVPEKKQHFQWLDGKKKELTLDEVTEIEEFLEDDF